MEKTTFSISSVAEMTGVSKNRIREWHEKGLLPGVQTIAVGTRQHRRFTEDDIRTIAKIDELQRQGFVLRVAAEKAGQKLTGIYKKQKGRGWRPVLQKFGVSMKNINLNEHYLAFRWAVSKDWKDKNELYRSIQYKVKVLTEEYGLSEGDIIDDLFANYWERGHYNKYDEKRLSLNNWIANYVTLYLNHLIRKYSVRSKDMQDQRVDPIDQRNQANQVCLVKKTEEMILIINLKSYSIRQIQSIYSSQKRWQNLPMMTPSCPKYFPAWRGCWKTTPPL